MPFSRWKTNDEGYITIASAGISAIVITLLVALAWQAGNLVAREQAQVAADLSAVAGAYGYARGETDSQACAISQNIAELNEGSLKHCTISGEDLIVEITVRGQVAHAKAGPL